MIRNISDNYFERFSSSHVDHSMTFMDQTGLTVVIPAFNEPELSVTLENLWKATPISGRVAVIVVVNFSEESTAELKSINENQAKIAEAWFADQNNEHKYGFVLQAFNLEAKHAGVGMARKIGMDQALMMFTKNKCDGWIISLDADCTVSNNYFLIHEQSWKEGRRGAINYFEHPMDNEAMVMYELYLRYVVQSLKWSGFKYATHTIGSTFAVRASVYASLGGMNKRLAGEDFYFIQKLMSNGSVKQITASTVFPSDRPSERVPFGTGRAVESIESFQMVYNFEIFRIIKKWLIFLQGFKKAHVRKLESAIPKSISKYIPIVYFEEIREMDKNTKNQESFTNRLFQWFNNFKMIKFMHRLRDKFGYESQPIADMCAELLREHNIPILKSDIRSLLLHFRHLDKQWENE